MSFTAPYDAAADAVTQRRRQAQALQAGTSATTVGNAPALQPVNATVLPALRSSPAAQALAMRLAQLRQS